MEAIETQLGDLSCIVLSGGPDADLAVVLCHGYGAPGDDLVGIGVEWARRLGEAATRVRFVFPAAPHSLAEMGMPAARAWWPLNMQRLMMAIEAQRFDELHDHEPPGLETARDQLTDAVTSVLAQMPSANPTLILGGFSQGAMLAMDTALRGLQRPPEVLLQMSGTLICQSAWQPLAHRLTDTEVLQSHGTLDQILPFQSAEALRDLLRAADVPVEFLPFEGPHTVPGSMIDSVADLLLHRIESP